MALVPIKPSQVSLAYNSGADVDIDNDVLVVGSNASSGQVAKLSPAQLRDAIIPVAGQRYWNVDPGPGFGDEYSYTDDAVLTAAQDGAAINNAGAAKAIEITLPAAVAGMEFAIDRVALFSITVTPDGTDTITTGNPGASYVINTDGLTVFSCISDTAWRVSIGGVKQYFLDIRDVGASPESTPAENLAALVSKINEAPSRGGTIFVSPASSDYTISDTFTITDRVSVKVLGLSPPSRDAGVAGSGGPSSLKVDAGWATTKALIQITSTAAADTYKKGGNQLSGLSIVAGATPWAGGYGLHILKGAADTDFWGDIIVDDTVIYNGNIGIYLDDTVVGGNGFGWLTVSRAKIESNLFGIKSNKTLNVVRVRDSTIRWNNQTSNSNYISRTGGGIVIQDGNAMLFHGNDLEGQQIGLQLVGGGRNIDVRANYLEVMFDAAFVFNGATDVVIENNYLANDYKTKHIYLKNCTRVKDAYNSESVPVIAFGNRDIDTDSPRNIRFTTEVNQTATAGTQSLDDYGSWMQSIPQRLPAVQASIGSSRPMQTRSVSGTMTSVVTYAGVSPDGITGKCIEATAGANYAYIAANWLSSDIAIVEGQWVVISARVYAPLTNTSSAQLYFEATENINGAGSTLKQAGTIPITQFRRGEWMMFQWFHKVLTGQTTYRGGLKLSIPTSGNKLVIGGISLNVVEQPAIIPYWSYFGATDNASFIHDGRGRFFGAAKPADANLTWNDGEEIVLTNQVTVSSPGYFVTVTGTGGGTARFAAIAALGAEAA